MTAGYIYVLSNPSMPGIVKVGRTAREVDSRARELATTGVPTPFKVEHLIPSGDIEGDERRIHAILGTRGLRVRREREFFRVTPDEAVAVVSSVVQDDGDVEELAAAAVEAVGMPDYGKEIGYAEALAIEERIGQFAHRYSLAACHAMSRLFSENCPSTLKFREYQTLLALSYLRMAGTTRQSSFMDNYGTAIADLVLGLHNLNGLVGSDAKAVTELLLSGEGRSYEKYISLIQRSNLPEKLKIRWTDV